MDDYGDRQGRWVGLVIGAIAIVSLVVVALVAGSATAQDRVAIEQIQNAAAELARQRMILAQLLFRGWALWGSWFYFDDLAFMSRAMNQPFGADYLFDEFADSMRAAQGGK